SMNFSRRKLIMPLPPSPAFTYIETSSTNFIGLPPAATAGQLTRTYRIHRNKKAPSRDRAFSAYATSGGHDAHVTAVELALHVELDHAVYFRKQGVILAHAYAVAGVELGAALTHDDVAGLDGLTTVHLHA